MSIADIMAVLYSLPHVLRDEMANGNAVKLDGIGSFALTVQCHKTGVANAEDVDPYTQITNVKVQFRPEKASVQIADAKKMQTSLVANDITWVELQEKKGTKNADGTTTPTGGNGGTTPTPGGDGDEGLCTLAPRETISEAVAVSLIHYIYAQKKGAIVDSLIKDWRRPTFPQTSAVSSAM